MIHYIPVDNTLWPIDHGSEFEDSAEWVLRFGTEKRREDMRMSVASILSAYADLVDPARSQEDAQEMLKRARKAAEHGWYPS
jgi:hypothetical protein